MDTADDLAGRIPGDVMAAQIDALDALVAAAMAEGPRADWGAVWGMIRSIGSSFPQAWFSSGQARGVAWNRFQAIAGRVQTQRKEGQQSRQTFLHRKNESRKVAGQILSLARSAWPHEEGFIQFLGTITGANIFAEVISALIEMTVQIVTFGLLGADSAEGPRANLKRHSEKLQEAWGLYHEHRELFLYEDRRAVRDLLLRVQSELNTEWARFKAERHGASTDRISQKHQLISQVATLARSDPATAGERSKKLMEEWKEVGYVGNQEQERHLWDTFQSALEEFWKERRETRKAHLEQILKSMRANILKLEASIEHDESVLEEKQEKLASVIDGRRADEIREHLQIVIDDLSEKIERKRGWVSDQEEKMDDVERKLSDLK